MSVRLQRQSVLSPSTSTQCTAEKWLKVQCLCNADLNHISSGNWKHTRKRSFIICTGSGSSKYNDMYRSSLFLDHYLVSTKSKGEWNLLFASADDEVAVDIGSQATSSSDVGAVRVKLDQSLQHGDYDDKLLLSLHDAARLFELAIKQSSPSKMPWFTAAWLGVDNNAWVKALSYLSAVYSLLQAATEISSCAKGRESDVQVVLRRSLLQLSAPLESIVREKLSSKQPEILEWFWSEQVPVVVTDLVNHLENDPRFKAATMFGERTTMGANESDLSLLTLSLTCASAISKLGPAKVDCSQFLNMIPEITGRLMDMLVDLVPIREAYQYMKEIGMHREFLVHFGPRAASSGVIDDCGTDEIIFWVDLVQKLLQQAIDREKIWSRLTTSESIEVLGRDLAIFGVFIALGRSTKYFLVANGFKHIDEPIEGFIRYLIGGCVLYYPQLSAINIYQLYVEVVCEELDWLPFYPGYTNSLKCSDGHNHNPKGPPNVEAILRSLDVCSHWIQSFIKHSKWLHNSSNVKADNFISKGHNKLRACMEEHRVTKNKLMDYKYMKAGVGTKNRPISLFEKELGSFEKALESIEEMLVRVEKLLRALNVSSSKSEKENSEDPCSDLENIRTLKKEAEFLEASFREMAASLQQDHGSLEEAALSSIGPGTSDSNEFRWFELLRSQLMKLEKQVPKNTNQPENEEIMEHADEDRDTGLVTVQKDGNVVKKSFDKLKETSTDVWQGTQLLAIDVASSMGLLRRLITRDELTEREKKFLRRTLMDVASVVPIGVLMLLPVTAVGHAAMLAAIKRYVPGLIPSTYGPERLDLFRQLEKMKEVEASDARLDENVNELT